MRVIVSPRRKGAVISPEIYGHFSEHLGQCIYGGIYVGPGSAIPNENGIRKDVVSALKKIGVPVLRWPGGCFADDYHWMDAIGPQTQRKKLINNFWGGVTEDNSFGTHEFMELCRQLSCKPYVNMNVGSGSVREMKDWVEYISSDAVSPMTDLRKKNGREAPWALPYVGVGNENWGCGGNMRPEYYADEYRRYQTFVRSYATNKVFRIACGAGTGVKNPGYEWTETLMRQAGGTMDGLSLHYYTISGDTWEDKGSATLFDTPAYYKMLWRAEFTDSLLAGHEAIMDRYDPRRRIGLIFDEWGTWHSVEPGTNPGFLYQQNTMRDALVAAISLNIFNRHASRVRMANIAQMINVLQAVILTADGQMLCTPTYHVFDLFRQHQGAVLVDTGIDQEYIQTGEGALPRLSASASVKDGKVFVTLSNAHAEEAAVISLRIDGAACVKAEGRLLSGDMRLHNTFEQPGSAAIVPLQDISLRAETMGTEVAFTLPPCAVAAITFDWEDCV
jgi:alpha-L-arabinofuranosidase